jgi:hypothetical protein
MYKVHRMAQRYTDLSKTNEVLKSILEATAHTVGQAFFNQLLKSLNRNFGIRFSIITECINASKTRVRTLAFLDDMDIQENVE